MSPFSDLQKDKDLLHADPLHTRFLSLYLLTIGYRQKNRCVNLSSFSLLHVLAQNLRACSIGPVWHRAGFFVFETARLSSTGYSKEQIPVPAGTDCQVADHALCPKMFAGLKGPF